MIQYLQTATATARHRNVYHIAADDGEAVAPLCGLPITSGARVVDALPDGAAVCGRCKAKMEREAGRRGCR
jgi:hypothetical protein